MLDPLDRFSRDSSLFQFTNKRLRDFIDPGHLLIQIDVNGGEKLGQGAEQNVPLGRNCEAKMSPCGGCLLELMAVVGG